MKRLGAWMIAFGIFSILIGFVGLQFHVLWFLDEFGPLMGYVLKAGLIVAGIWVWRNADKIPADEYEEPAGNNRAWIPVAVSGAVILGVIAYVAISQLRGSWLDRQLNRPAPPAAWASTPVKQWPALVLLQKAEFKHHTPMQAGCACLIRLPTGDIVALTAGHLLGKAGGRESRLYLRRIRRAGSTNAGDIDGRNHLLGTFFARAQGAGRGSRRPLWQGRCI